MVVVVVVVVVVVMMMMVQYLVMTRTYLFTTVTVTVRTKSFHGLECIVLWQEAYQQLVACNCRDECVLLNNIQHVPII
jgi:hypothetical protein